jgi:truncated hemoglobin YjbI
MKAVLLCLALVAGALCASPTSFTVTSANKTPAHPYYQQGFPVGYYVNNAENNTLVLYVGITYTFTVTASCLHPFYITTDPSGQNVSEVTTGITATNYNQVCGGASLSFTPTADQQDMTYFYQCRTHSKMGWKIVVRAEPFCDKYSRLLGVSNSDLVSLVVGQVFANLTATNAPLLPYFNGQIPAGSTNFTNPANTAQTQMLADHLIQFFGLALGCSDNTIAPYAGRTDMKAVHKNMPIGKVEFDTFNEVVIGVMKKNGVADADLVGVLAVLQSLAPAICNDPSSCKNSICDRYSRLLGVTNVQLVSLVVSKTFEAALGSPTLVGFFDGTVPAGSTDFTTNQAAATALSNSLVAFFGAALSCTDPGFPTYTGGTMKAVHANMPIGLKEFNTFNSALLGVLASAGVAQNDLDAVNAVLQSTKADICNQPDCLGLPPTTTFVLQVAPKNAHPWKGQGYPDGFVVDGTEGPILTLQVGKSYTFQNNAPCIHPLYISSSDQGAGAGEVTAGVTFPNGDNLGTCGGKQLVFTPQASQNGMTLYYQCQAHVKMGYQLQIGTGSVTGGVTAGTQPSGTAEDSAAGVVGVSVFVASLLALFAIMF